MIGSKFLRFETALKSAHYRTIVDEIVDCLAARGFFQKDAVLETTGYDCMADAIRWDYIVRMLDELHNVHLIPMNAAFFKRTSEKLKREHPVRFIAGGGHGKSTAGYCQATQENGHFVLKRLEMKEQIAEGVEASVTRTRKLIERHGIVSILPQRRLRHEQVG